jgi:two-component system, sensor histidine kinase and response regulator
VCDSDPHEVPAAVNRGARILVAEDNLLSRKVARHQLQTMGHTVDTAGNGFEAVEALKNNPYDLVLMDCQMPGMDGFAATAAIRQRERELGLPHLPVIAMTASALESDREHCIAAGMDGYLSKPVGQAELAKAIETWVRRDREAEGPDAEDSIDGETLATLREMGKDTSFFVEVIDLFLEEAPRQLDALREAVAAGDAERARLAAHSLKGAAGNVGAKPMARSADRLEKLARAQSLEGAREIVQDLEGQLERARRTLNAARQRTEP